MPKIILFVIISFILGCGVRPVQYWTNEKEITEAYEFQKNSVNASVVWKQFIGSQVISSGEQVYVIKTNPLISGDLFYITKEQEVTAYSVKTGETKKSYALLRGRDIFVIQPASQPLDNHEMLYVYDTPMARSVERVNLLNGDNTDGVGALALYRGAGYYLVPIVGSSYCYVVEAGRKTTEKYFKFKVFDEQDVYEIIPIGRAAYVVSYLPDLKRIILQIFNVDMLQSGKVLVLSSQHEKDILFSVEYDMVGSVLFIQVADNRGKITLHAVDINKQELLWSKEGFELISPSQNTGYVVKEQHTGLLHLLDIKTGVRMQTYHLSAADSLVKAVPSDSGLGFLLSAGAKEAQKGINREQNSAVHIFLPLLIRIDGYPGLTLGEQRDSFGDFEYSKFQMLDSNDGNVKWEISDGVKLGMPLAGNGMFIWGKPFDKYEFTSQYRQKVQHVFASYEKSNINEMFSNEVLALDSASGKTLFTFKISDSQYPYIENIWLQDDMLLVKTVSGWLYAIAFEQSDKKRLH